jgi:hypothetical protein
LGSDFTFKTQICHQGSQGILKIRYLDGIQMAEALGFVWYPRRIGILLPVKKGWRMCGTLTLRFWLVNFNSSWPVAGDLLVEAKPTKQYKGFENTR